MRVPVGLWFGVLLLPLVLGVALTTPVLAGEDEAAREVATVKAQIKALRREARALEEEGHAEEAREVRMRADDLARRLEAYFARRKRKEDEHAAKHAAKRDAEADAKRTHAILRGLGQGIEALQALGKHEEAARLKAIHAGVKKRIRPAQGRAQRSERRIVEGWIELMGYAVKVLARNGNPDRAELLEHGKHAFELALAGKKDARSMEIRESAPARVRMAECLLHAAEILHDKGDERHAKLMADLGRQWQKQARRRAKPQAEREHADLESLATRVEILRTALPALREGERKKAAAILERGIRSGKVLLAEREDAEAREILEATPSLGHLAEVLHLASDLWATFGHERKARVVARLAYYYAERWKAQQEEREHAGHGDDDEGHGDDERAEQLEELQHQMADIREALERLQKQLRALTRDR